MLRNLWLVDKVDCSLNTAESSRRKQNKARVVVSQDWLVDEGVTFARRIGPHTKNADSSMCWLIAKLNSFGSLAIDLLEVF
jgi:hypothetical protein